jgi:hypothetical protein
VFSQFPACLFGLRSLWTSGDLAEPWLAGIRGFRTDIRTNAIQTSAYALRRR